MVVSVISYKILAKNNIFYKLHKIKKFQNLSFLYFHNSGSNIVTIDHISKTIKPSKNQEYIPRKYLTKHQNQEILKHLKWMLQKDILGQDMFLIGAPGLSRRNLAMAFSELTDHEIEFIALSRDTTEADLKQRKEIKNGTVYYHNQSAIRAAIEGRILIIEGIEKAERNILPILNNLLENREMHLEDGHFLISASRYDALLKEHGQEELNAWKLVRVSEDFKVIALGLPIPRYPGHPLDPPLRSRFQARHIPSLSFEEQLASLESISSNVSNKTLSQLLSCCYALNMEEAVKLSLPEFPLDNLPSALTIMENSPNLSLFEVFYMFYPYKLFLNKEKQSSVEYILKTFGILNDEHFNDFSNKKYHISNINKNKDFYEITIMCNNTKSSTIKIPHNLPELSKISKNFYVETSYQNSLIAQIMQSHTNLDVCLIGPKGCGKSITIQRLAELLDYQIEHIVLYQDMTSRDLIQHRTTLPNGDTVWKDSPLIIAALQGKLTVLDGIHRVDPTTLSVISRIIHDRELQLYDGKRLVREDRYNSIKTEFNKSDEDMKNSGIYKIHPAFKIIALAEPPVINNARSHWLTSEILNMFIFHEMRPLQKDALLYIIKKKYGEPKKSLINVIELAHSLRSANDSALQSIGNSLSTRQLLRIAARVHKFPDDDIYDIVHRVSLAKFLPSITKEAFEDSLKKFRIFSSKRNTFNSISCTINDNKVTIGKTTVERYNTTALTKVPNILFYEIPQHLKLLEILVQDFILGENILLIGNQGVGKNKIIDRLLQILNRPREYIQLHRDTTVQTLTALPMIKDGVIVYKDSALVQAVRLGHVLIVDEADKAPTHVTCVLKTLVESGEMILSDGRRIVSVLQNNKQNEEILIHPDFKMIILANRPGFPFLGNDFFGTIGDVFSTHSMDNPDIENEVQLLKQYGPDVNEIIIHKLVSVFSELRNMADQNLVSYPYSTREVINILKHLQKFPDDSLANVVKNVFDFDQYSHDMSSTLLRVFHRHGIPTDINFKDINLAKKIPISDLKHYTTWNIQSNYETLPVQENSIKYKQLSIPEQQIFKLNKKECRTEKFTELVRYWNLPLSENCIVVSLLINQIDNKIYILTHNPVSLYILSKDLENIQKINIQDLGFPLTSNSSQYTLTNDKKGNIFIHEQMTNSLLSINFLNGNVNNFQLSSTFDTTSNKISRIFGNQNFIWKLQADPIMLKNQLINFTINNNKIGVIDLETMTTYKIELPFKINSILFVSSDTWLVQNTSEEKFILQKLLSTDLCPSILKKIDETGFETNILGSLLLCNNSNITSKILNKASQHKIDSQNRVIVTDNTYASIATGFPEINTPIEIFSMPRKQKVDSLIIPIITERGDIIRIVSSSNVPKTALNNETLHFKIHNYIEITDIMNKEVRYIPIQISRTLPSTAEKLYNVEHSICGGLISNQELITVDASGCIRLWETCSARLETSLKNWKEMIETYQEKIQITKSPYSNLDVNSPKHGKVDPKNEPHVGGNTWAGGTGGRDTAGLGGKGGPYRLDAGHTVHQLSDEEKSKVPEHILKAAREMGQTAFKKQLKDIKMSEYDHKLYSKFYNSVEHEVQTLQKILGSLETKSKNRVWCRNQTTGELDDAKLIEGVTGEKNIYRRLADKDDEIDTTQSNIKRLKLVVDVSGSMYRFNSYDGRLDREMEAVVMVMEAFQGFENKIQYDIVGHSGDSHHIEFIDHVQPPCNNKQRLEVIRTMYAHSQYCLSGDHTLESTEYAINSLAKENSDASIVIVFSDANLSRYGIRASTFSKVLMSNINVNAYAIFIGSLGDQAVRLKEEIPSGRAFICMDLKNIPRILQQIFTASLFSGSN